MKPIKAPTQPLPLKIVGLTDFGKYPKISYEQSINLIVSDDGLVNYAGYGVVTSLIVNGDSGRGIYASSKINAMIAVVDNHVFRINTSLSAQQIGSLNTFSGDVFIAENNGGQIALCDKSFLYVYNYNAGTFTQVNPGFIPTYIAFQDGYGIATEANTSNWYLSSPNDFTVWNTPVSRGVISTKPTIAQAAIPVPGKGNLLFMFGTNVTEPWYDVGYQLFPYQRSTFNNIDYGCLNPATIAANDNMVVWLSRNNISGPSIVMSDGGPPQRISNDGIDYRLAYLQHPEQSVGFFFRQDGHLIYQLTFYNKADNLSLAYDFTSKGFSILTDQRGNFHIARRLAFFNDSYFFVSISDGNLYEMSTQFLTYLDKPEINPFGDDIPRIRICPTIGLPDRTRFVIPYITFPIEQGMQVPIPTPYSASNVASPQRVDLSISVDGNEVFGNYQGVFLNPPGERANNLNWWQCGSANEFTPSFRFYGQTRFVAKNGEVGVKQ